MLGEITPAVIATIGQRIKKNAQSLFSTVSPSTDRRGRGNLRLAQLRVFRPRSVREAHRVIDNVPNLFFLQGRAEGGHGRPLDARIDAAIEVERATAAAIDARRQVARFDRVAPVVEQSGDRALLVRAQNDLVILGLWPVPLP